MRILGLDIGLHRIGVAVSDETGTIAQPLTVIKADASPQATIQKIKSLLEEYEVGKVVIGLPLSLSGGGQGQSARVAKRFGSALQEETAVEIAYWDERFTTTEAERVLLEAGTRRAARRQVIDKVAASLILQGYLDRRSPDAEDAS